MCFYSKTKDFKIAKRPIRVYKGLNEYNGAPYRKYHYRLGLNTPTSKFALPETKYDWNDKVLYIFTSGLLHSFKFHVDLNNELCIDKLVEMYIPSGARYKDDGYGPEEIVSTALYWPKNKFERWWYNLISKKY